MISIVMGIAALVSVGSFGENLEVAIDDQAKTLMGADFMMRSLRPYPPEVEALIDSIGGEQAREILFGSMAYFPASDATRLVQVRALEGDFPFYGDVVTEPPAAASGYKQGPYALVDNTLLLQYDAAPGDTIQIGGQAFEIAGGIIKLPSEPPIASTFNPRVYLPARHLDQTHLLQRGSLVNYRIYFKIDKDQNLGQLTTGLQPAMNRHRIDLDTVEDRKRQIGDAMENLYRFLNLVGFVALILGSIGVASAVHVYTKQKLSNVSILRCVGAEARQTFLIYLIQVAGMGFLGSLMGAMAGMVIQVFLPAIFSEFLPVTVESFIAWKSVLAGFAIGFALALLFALLPLLGIRKVSPLLALRASYEPESTHRDKAVWVVYGLILIFTGGFAISQAEEWQYGAGFLLSLFAALALLAGAAKLLTVAIRKFFPKSWAFVWRQGLANLYRPNNQTLVLMLAIGLGAFLITTLYLSRHTLLNKITFAAGGDRPNLILFDIQPDQKEALFDTVRAHGLPVVQEAPMVTMRLESLNGEPVEAILGDSTRDVSNGLLRWEFRTTYRDSLFESEKIIAGEWIPEISSDLEVIPISMEEGAAERINVAPGDTIVWNVQGVPLTTRVASLREVDWQRIQANFMVVFPKGALEYAPQIYIMATKAPTTESSAKLQRAVVQSFPNVSMIDLSLVLKTVDGFVTKIAFVIRFMALFSIVTGLIVLAAALITSRFQRVQESVLLRTLGAQRGQIRKIMIVEYAFLGGLAAITGLVLAYAGGWAMAFFVFDAVFVPTILPFVVAFICVTSLTVFIGLSNSRGILDRPPLEVLRAEA